ncbi:MAG: YraN family protein [Sedimentisphaerales bacterium]|jgi:putative endonuclease
MFDFLLNRKKLLGDTQLLGKWGERRCEKFLKRKGLKTLTRNYACKAGEIDLIMVDSDRSIVFVEVKTRANEDFAPTESVITTQKMDKMTKTARYFISVHEIENRPYRFDVVTVTLGQRGPVEIRHYKNAFVK